MRAIRLLAGRTFSSLFTSWAAWGAIVLFLASFGALFVYAIVMAHACAGDIPVVWAQSVASTLPFLTALLTMRLWASARRTGCLDMLLTTPVLESEMALGKWLGVYFLTVFSLFLALVVPLYLLPYFKPTLSVSWFDYMPGFLALCLQAAFLDAFGVFLSACCRQAAVAAVWTLFLTVFIPWCGWLLASLCLPAVRAWGGDYPFTRYVVDAAHGFMRPLASVAYGVTTCLMLFACSRMLVWVRLVGRGARTLRLSTVFSIALAFLLGVMFTVLALSIECPFLWPSSSSRTPVLTLTPRTKAILRETSGTVKITCLTVRSSAAFVRVRRLLEVLQFTSRTLAGVRIDWSLVDPHWDIGLADAFVQQGVPPDTVVFMRDKRRTCVPIAQCDESAVASAILRLALRVSRETIYWTSGHGERSFESYDVNWGMSDFARSLRSNGHTLATLQPGSTIPHDCSLLVVAGARTGFSREEMREVDAYLKRGGRLLAFVSADIQAGVTPLLARWGVQTKALDVLGKETLGGHDILVRAFSAHAVTRPLDGCTLRLSDTSAVFSSSLAQTDTAKDRTVFTPLVMAGKDAQSSQVFSAALERGGGVARDLSIRSTRIIVVGDTSFVSNGALTMRANANCDFALNAVAWLSGFDATLPPGASIQEVAAGFSRRRVLFLAVSAIVLWPVVAFLVCWIPLSLKRRLM